MDTELALRRAAVDLEQAGSIPDVNINAGVKRFEENSENAFTVGFSIPLPIFDRNQGGILEARQKLAKGVAERRAADLRVKADLGQVYQVLSAAYLGARERVALAQANFTREQELWKEKISAEQEYLDARQALAEALIEQRSASQKLHTLGYGEPDLQRLAAHPERAFTTYEITAAIPKGCRMTSSSSASSPRRSGRPPIRAKS